MHFLAKFYGDGAIRYWVLKFFTIFKISAAAILDF